jgi:hypothetical protein
VTAEPTMCCACTHSRSAGLFISSRTNTATSSAKETYHTGAPAVSLPPRRGRSERSARLHWCCWCKGRARTLPLSFASARSKNWSMLPPVATSRFPSDPKIAPHSSAGHVRRHGASKPESAHRPLDGRRAAPSRAGDCMNRAEEQAREPAHRGSTCDRGTLISLYRPL